jgi:hypothetical protein
MPQVGFEPTIAVFERAKTVHALGRAATVFGNVFLQHKIIINLLNKFEILGLCRIILGRNVKHVPNDPVYSKGEYSIDHAAEHTT